MDLNLGIENLGTLIKGIIGLALLGISAFLVAGAARANPGKQTNRVLAVGIGLIPAGIAIIGFAGMSEDLARLFGINS